MAMNNRRVNGIRTASKSAVDRRLHSRYELTVPITFHWKGERGVRHRGQGYTRDVSKHGVFVLTNACPPPESELRIEVHLPPLKRCGAPVEMRGRGRVVRIEAKPRMRSWGFAAEVENFTLHNKARGFLRATNKLPEMWEEPVHGS